MLIISDNALIRIQIIFKYISTALHDELRYKPQEFSPRMPATF